MPMSTTMPLKAAFATLVLLGLLTMWLPQPALPQTPFEAVVVEVQDGDSLMVKPVKGPQKTLFLRLYGIDAPELRQNSGKGALNTLQKLLPKGSRVTVTPMNKDSYDRVVALVSRKGQVINQELVRRGAAWVYDRHCTIPLCNDLRRDEANAGKQHRGLWKVKHVIPPWIWREQIR